jgi:hypothetical protein
MNKKGVSKFQASSSTVTHTALRARSRIAFDALSLSFHKERAKEKEPGRSLRGLPASRRSDDERRGCLFCKNPPSAGHIPHPADGSTMAKALAFPSCLKFCPSRGASQIGKVFVLFIACYFRVRICFKCERNICICLFSCKYERNDNAATFARCGFLKGVRPLSFLSFAISL